MHKNRGEVYNLMIDKSKLGITLLFIGSVQWFFGLLLAESLFPSYSSTIDYVSDLGTGPSAAVYNGSVFLMGLCIALSSYFLYDAFRSNPFTVLLFLTGIGAMGVGLFPANMQPFHSLFTLIAIMSGALSAISSYPIQKVPLSVLSVILGILAIGASILFMPYLGLPVGATDTFLGMAKGSMERWAIYPLLLWMIIFSSSFMRNSEEY